MTVLAQNLVAGSMVGDATFQTGLALRLTGLPFTATATGTPDKLTIRTTAAGHTVRFGIYKNSGTAPTDLISVSNTLTSVLNGNIEFMMTSTEGVVSGTQYWLAPLASNGGAIFSANNAVLVTRRNGQTLATINDPFPNPYVTINTTANIRLVTFILESTTVSIVGVNQARTGQSSRIDFNAAFAPTSVSITGDTITKNITPSVVDADSVDAVVPAWVDGETCVKIGPVTFTATDGVKTTDPFNDDLEFWSAEADDPTVFQFTPIEIASLATGNLSSAVGLTPAWQVGTQVIFNSSRALIGVDGVYGGNHTGESYVWYRNPDDKVARQVTVITQDGEIISGGGLTARGLTNTGLSTPGLTTKGL